MIDGFAELYVLFLLILALVFLSSISTIVIGFTGECSDEKVLDWLIFHGFLSCGMFISFLTWAVGDGEITRYRLEAGFFKFVMITWLTLFVMTVISIVVGDFWIYSLDTGDNYSLCSKLVYDYSMSYATISTVLMVISSFCLGGGMILLHNMPPTTKF